MTPESNSRLNTLAPHLLYAIVAFVVCSSAWLNMVTLLVVETNLIGLVLPGLIGGLVIRLINCKIHLMASLIISQLGNNRLHNTIYWMLFWPIHF